MPYKKLIAVDFDGVLHSYTSPWTDAATISDGPTPGAMHFLKDLVDDGRFDVVIVSSRMKAPEGRSAIERWLWPELVVEFGGTEANRIQLALSFSEVRPPAFVTLDDRGLQFTGLGPDLDTLAAFKPWNKRPAATIVEDAMVGPDASTMIEFDRAGLREIIRKAWSEGNECRSCMSDAEIAPHVDRMLENVIRRLA